MDFVYISLPLSFLTTAPSLACTGEIWSERHEVSSSSSFSILEFEFEFLLLFLFVFRG